MPYSGVPEGKTEAMERCVTQVMGKGKERGAAIAICKTSIIGDATLSLEAATEEDVLALQAAMGQELEIRGSYPTNAILKFENACLARAEVNANRDGINTDGIKQLAETIRLMPLTYEHEDDARGVFTRGTTNEDSTKCLVSGFLWAGRWPEFAEEIRTGVRKLSLDAEAELAVCSVCGAAFTTGLDYCEHIRGREDGAVRWLFDITAVAGGAVLNPAGTGTVFPGSDGLTVISHKLDAVTPAPEEPPAEQTSGKEPAPKKRSGKVTGKGGRTDMDITCPDCGHEHSVATKAEELQAQLEAKLEELQQAKADMETLQTQADSIQEQLDQEKLVVERFVELSVGAGLEVAKEALPSLRKVDDEVFQTLKSMASRKQEAPVEEEEEDDPPAPPVPVAASGDGDAPPVSGSDTWDVIVD